jgi:hypothetical protein
LEVSKTKQGVKVENKPDSTLKLHRIYTDFGVYITLGHNKQQGRLYEGQVRGRASGRSSVWLRYAKDIAGNGWQ